MVDNPRAKEVTDFHRRSDVDKSAESQHHTLGNGMNQASPGNHTHDGRTSKALFEGLSVTGSRSTDSANVLQQILIVLRSQGLQDGTTP